MSDAHSFMQIMVNSPEIVACLKLGDQQVEAFHLVRKGKRTTPDIAKALDISTQHASKLLADLYKIGYLSRRRSQDPTGGWMYEYFCFDATISRSEDHA